MQLFDSIQINVQMPVMVRVDSVAAIRMSENVTATTRTKHIDIRVKFVREYVEDELIKIIFVRSEANACDILTKNLPSDLHQKHSKKIIGDN